MSERIHDPGEELADSEMSLGDHLEELRSRLLRSVVVTIVTFLVVFAYRDPVLAFVVQPYRDVARDLHISSVLSVFGPTQSFFSYMKVSLIVSILVAAPFWIWQAWAFVSAGLYRHERSWVYRFAPLMIALFALGVSFGYTVLIPIGLEYLLSFQDPLLLQNWIGVSEYLAFFTTLTLVLGMTFQLPVVLALLTRLEVLSIETLKTKRRHFILGAFIVSALLTPPDAVTQVLMAFPLLLLFEFGIFLSWLALGERRPPIDGRTWRRRALIGIVLIAVVAVFQEQLVTAYRARLVKGRLASTGEAAEEGVPYLRIFRESLPGFRPRDAYLVARDEGEDEGIKLRELWIAGDAEDGRLLELVFRDTRLTVMTEASGERPGRLLLQPSTQSIEVREIRQRPGREFLPPLLKALGEAEEGDARVLSTLLEGLVGRRAPGAPAATAEPFDAGEAAKAWSSWFEADPTWVHRSRER